MREFFRLAEAADRNLLEQRLPLRFGELLRHHRGFHVSRRDPIHGNAEARNLARE